MSLSKTAANTASTTNEMSQQAQTDTLFVAQADLLIANAIAFGQFKCTLTFTKGVSATNVQNYYNGLGYQTLVGYSDNYGFDSISYNTIGDGYNIDAFQLDQPADLFGVFYDAYWNGNLTNNLICDGITPLYLYLSWA